MSLDPLEDKYSAVLDVVGPSQLLSCPVAMSFFKGCAMPPSLLFHPWLVSASVAANSYHLLIDQKLIIVSTQPSQRDCCKGFCVTKTKIIFTQAKGPWNQLVTDFF